MRKLYAILLMICLGIVVPIAAQPMRVCLLDLKERTEDCCEKCNTEHTGCCADVDQIPDSPLPGGGVEIPPFVAFEEPVFEAAAPREVVMLSQALYYTPPIRGPDSPSAFRSILSVWRL